MSDQNCRVKDDRMTPDYSYRPPMAIVWGLREKYYACLRAMGKF
jgi:hypothetical protein